MTAEELYQHLQSRQVRTIGRPHDFKASCPCPRHGRGQGDVNPSVHVTNLGNRFRVCCFCCCDGYDVVRGWGLHKLAERMEQADAFHRALQLVPPVDNKDERLTCQSLLSSLLSKPLAARFRDDVRRVFIDMAVHQRAYETAGCSWPVLYATTYCAERMGWYSSGKPVAKRASRALRWLEEEGWIACDGVKGRTKCYRVPLTPPPTSSGYPSWSRSGRGFKPSKTSCACPT